MIQIDQPKQVAETIDVCLVSPPSRVTSQVVPHALMCLIGWVEERGYVTDLVDVKRSPHARPDAKGHKQVMQEIVERAVASKARMIGFTAFTSDLIDVIELARMIRKRSDAKIIVGGVHAGLAPQGFFAFEDSPIDIVVVGEGEETLTELLEAQREGSLALESIDGLLYRENGRVIHTSPRQALASLDRMPLPPYHKLDMKYYLRPQRNVLRYVLLSGVHVFTARGCPYACTFCANRMRKVRYRPIEHVVEELKMLKELYDIDGFYIQDDTFTIKAERVIEFCEQLKAQKLGTVWGMEGRVNQLRDSVYNALKEAGCIQFDFGVESGSQVALNRMKKGIKVADTEQIFAKCRQDGIRTLANMMFNTPGETEQDVKDTISLMERINATTYGLNLTVPLIGTQIYEQYVKPPLMLEEYRLFADERAYHSIVDPRFKLAAHNLDLERLYVQTLIRFTFWQSLRLFSLHPVYLRSLRFSSRKGQYLSAAMNYWVQQIRTYLRYGKAMVKRELSRLSLSKQDTSDCRALAETGETK